MSPSGFAAALLAALLLTCVGCKQSGGRRAHPAPATAIGTTASPSTAATARSPKSILPSHAVQLPADGQLPTRDPGQLAPKFSGFAISLDSIRTVYRLVGGFSTLRLEPTAERFVITEITIRETCGSATFDPQSFKMTTPDGMTYNSLEAVDALASLPLLGRKPLPSRTLLGGEQSHGSLIFDIPKGSASLAYSTLHVTDKWMWSIPPGE